MNNSLKSKSIIATLWTMIGFGGSQLVRLGSNLVLTRLLAPEMFGVMVIVNVIIVGFKLVSDIGLRPNIVQRKMDPDDRFLNTAWTVQVIKGFILWAATSLAALTLFGLQRTGIIGTESAYGNDQLPILIVIVGTSLIISGFGSVTRFTESRKLKMGRLTIIDFCGQAFAVVIMFVWAYFSPTIWALVAGAISVTLIRVAMSHLILDYRRHRLHLNREHVLEIITFGKWIAVSTFFSFMLMQGDRLILGGFLSASELGVYSIAFLLVSSLKKLFTTIGSMVVLPALSEIARTRPRDLSRIYYKLRLCVDLPVLFCCGVLAWLGQDVVNFLYDERYSDAGEMLEILTFSLIGVGLGLSGPCLIAIGKPAPNALANGVNAIALWVVTPITFVLFGFHAALWVIAFSFSASLPIQFWFLHKSNIFKWYKEVWALPALVAGYAVGYF